MVKRSPPASKKDAVALDLTVKTKSRSKPAPSNKPSSSKATDKPTVEEPPTQEKAMTKKPTKAAAADKAAAAAEKAAAAAEKAAAAAAAAAAASSAESEKVMSPPKRGKKKVVKAKRLPVEEVDKENDKENVAVANKERPQPKKRRVETPATVEPDSASVEPDSEVVDETKPLDVVVGVTGETGEKPVGVWMDAWNVDTLVVVAYTKANTPGCSKQCVAFSNASVPARTKCLGLSLDPETAQLAFAEKKNLSFPLVHTGGKELAAALRCLTATGKMVRSVVMLKRTGDVIFERHKVTPECAEAVRFLDDRANEVTEDEEAAAPAKRVTKRKATRAK